jgi:hypothetical protein
MCERLRNRNSLLKLPEEGIASFALRPFLHVNFYLSAVEQQMMMATSINCPDQQKTLNECKQFGLSGLNRFPEKVVGSACRVVRD